MALSIQKSSAKDVSKVLVLDKVGMNYHDPTGEIEAIREISLSVRDGEFVSIVGPSGCGKSTLLSIITGLMPPTHGSCLIDGEPTSTRTRTLGYMPQRDQLFEWRSILSNVQLGLEIQGRLDAAAKAHCQSLLQRYGLADFADKKPSQLSGGMRQRAALIRTLATNPRLLLLDEPFSALDYQQRLRVADEVSAIIREQGKAALLVTHDIAEAISLSDRVVVLSGRPSVVVDVHDIGLGKLAGSIKARELPKFQLYFNKIWRQLDTESG